MTDPDERSGRFVVIEGGEGTGKSTQVERLVQRLEHEGRVAIATYEPGDTLLGTEIRALLLDGDRVVDARAELLLMLADRAQHVAEVIGPAIGRGAVVVCDRYGPSTLAYQGVGRDLGIEAVSSISAFAANGIEPDVVVVLDLPDEVAATRVAADRDRMERAGAAFHARVRTAYRELAADRGWPLIDATGSRSAVADRIWASVAPIL